MHTDVHWGSIIMKGSARAPITRVSSSLIIMILMIRQLIPIIPWTCDMCEMIRAKLQQNGVAYMKRAVLRVVDSIAYTGGRKKKLKLI